MTFDRRRFLFGSVAAGLAAACGSRSSKTSVASGSAADPASAPPAKKSILILGGTGFLGPHVVDYARTRGHEITLFNRGKTRPGLYSDVETLHGDRDGKLEALVGRKWDAVVDTSGYLPRLVKMSAELLAPNVGHYVFVSTVSVYAKDDQPGADENAPLATMPDPTNESIREYYGALKALCEQAAEAAMPGRVANVRPGLIIGPGDPTGRFTHWPSRIADGGEVLAPGDGNSPTQYIDGRDLGAWIVRLIEARTTGIYNALGPAQRITMKQVLDACNEAGGNKAQLTWVPADFLAKNDVAAWEEMPMWFDPKGETAGFGSASNARAVKAGLTFRPIRETAADTLAWLQTVPEDKRTRYRSSGIAREKEAKVLAAWKASQR
ncbi:MAG: NAD-dependent epimerase/dehydratase family protein [Kofleriaceae bacterium]